MFFLDEIERLKVRFSGPLFQDDKLLGVLVIESSVENLLSSINDYTGLGDTGETVLAAYHKNGDDFFIMPTRFNSEAALRLTVPKEKNIPMRKSFTKKQLVVTDSVDYRNMPVLAVTRYVEKTDWGIVVKIDKAEAFMPLMHMQNLLFLIVFVSAVVVVFVSLYLARGITLPITRLTKVARRISQGELTTKADETDMGEIGSLARSFNTMTKNLADKVDELQDKEEHIRLLFNSTAEAIYGLDVNGNCTFCNPSCLKFLGYKEDAELLGQHMHTLTHHTRADGTEYPAEECRIYDAIHNNEGSHIDNEVLWRADGTSFWVEYWSYPIVKNDIIVGAVVTFIDISERVKAEETEANLEAKLRQAQKMEAVGTMAGGIAHDFNNILAAIIGYADLAKTQIEESNPAINMIEQVLKAGGRAEDLVQHILTFSRMSGQAQDHVKIDLIPILKEVLKFQRSIIPTTIEIRSDIEENCGQVNGDPTQLHQILMNLCTNAAHAMEEKGGVLEVGLHKTELFLSDLKAEPELDEGSYLMLSVCDNGSGIRHELIEKIFDPYFTTKEVGKGSGMGLSVVQGIVKNHGGFVKVESEPGKGSTFNVFFPDLKKR